MLLRHRETRIRNRTIVNKCASVFSHVIEVLLFVDARVFPVLIVEHFSSLLHSLGSVQVIVT